MADAVQGSQTRMLVKDGSPPYDWTTGSIEAWSYEREDVQTRGKHVDATGIFCGTRSLIHDRVAEGNSIVLGDLHFHPSPYWFEQWLPRFMGGTPSAGNFPLGEQVPEWGMLVDLKTKVIEFQSMKITRVILRGRQTIDAADPELIDAIVSVMGVVEDDTETWPGNAPNCNSGENNRPYVMPELSVNLLASNRQVIDWIWSLNNFLEPRFSTGSNVPTSITPAGRLVRQDMQLPFTTDEADLYGSILFPGSAPSSWQFVKGDMSTTMTHGVMTWPRRTPPVRGKTEVLLPISATARNQEGTPEADATNDSDPAP